MKNVFDVDNKLFSGMTKIWDLFVVDFLWIITVLAFFGPACTALYYTTVKNIRKSRGYTAQTYFHAFKTNFKQAAILGILQIVIVVGLVVGYQFAISMDENSYIGQVYFWVIILQAVLFAMVSVYIYPVLSRFDMKIGGILKLSLFMAFRHLPTTIYGVLGVVGVLMCWEYIFLTPIVLIAPAIYVLILSLLMEKALRNYMPKKEDQSETEQQAWYYE